MQRIPLEILSLFVHQDSSAEKRLLDWLVKNKIEKLDCSSLVIYPGNDQILYVPPSGIIKIAKVIASSLVHTVDFSLNRLGENGPDVAANLTGKHSKVQIVNLSANELVEHGPDVAANLTGEHSKVHTVNLSCNQFGFYGPKVAANLTGEIGGPSARSFSYLNF